MLKTVSVPSSATPKPDISTTFPTEKEWLAVNTTVTTFDVTLYDAIVNTLPGAVPAMLNFVQLLPAPLEDVAEVLLITSPRLLCHVITEVVVGLPLTSVFT